MVTPVSGPASGPRRASDDDEVAQDHGPLDVRVALDDRCEPPAPTPSPWAQVLGSVVTELLEAAGLFGRAEVGLHLVDPEEIAELKARYFGDVGAATDVLAFPVDGIDPTDGPRLVGDVVVCPEVARAQAPDHTGTFDDEMALLVTHAALHLVGHDHAEPEERAVMWRTERDLLGRHWRMPERDPWV